MKLYHYTTPANVMLIAGDGLRPRAKEKNAHMSNGIPVVWLTLQESIVATAADIAQLMARCGDDYGFKEGDLLFGGAARLTVCLERHDRRLMRYPDFLRSQGADMGFFRKRLLPDCLNKWWVYRGVIPARKIDTSLPPAVMLECLDHQIATHPNAEARDRFKMMRAQIAPLPPDYSVLFDIVKKAA
jgi:hypothetical protein